MHKSDFQRRVIALSRAGARDVRGRWDRHGVGSSSETVERQARAYWTDPGTPQWISNSHWRSGLGSAWETVGRSDLEITERLVRAVGVDWPSERTIEWGCGGGANAVRFASRCREFVGVDVSQESLEECERQVNAVAATPVRKVLIPLGDPESALDQVRPGSCDLFICFYVFELLPSKVYGSRLLDIARELLTADGVAVIQVKYSTSDPRTHSRRRGYRRGLADMTTFGIDEFWNLAAARGLTPHGVVLVPRNELDERYAYFALTRGSLP